MLIRQSKNSFIRIYDKGKIGYITNQLTYHDRTYNESGADFLSQISREPVDIDHIIDKLCSIYTACDRSILEHDFIEFAHDLVDHKFVVVGETENKLLERDIEFSYLLDNPKTLINDYTQQTKEIVKKSTQDFLLKHDFEKPRLASLQFEITSRCNERCIHCYIPNEKKDKGSDMPFEKFRYIIDQYSEMGGLGVTLSGGEALMNKDILKMLLYCREKDMKITLLTNLISLKEEQIPILKKVNLSLIQVSLYSMDAAIHDSITTIKGSYAKTKAAIEKLHAADIPIQISCPIMKVNKEGYKKVMQYAKSLRMKSQTDYIMMAQADLDTRNLNNRISLIDTEKVIRDIIEYDKDYIDGTLNQDSISI